MLLELLLGDGEPPGVPSARLDGSVLEIDEVAARIWCDACGCEQMVPGAFSMRCPICSETASSVVAGRELEILTVEMAGHG